MAGGVTAISSRVIEVILGIIATEMAIPLTNSLPEARAAQPNGRSDLNKTVKPSQHELGQFLTPEHIADLMASWFSAEVPEVRLLDAGAGKGALTAAFVKSRCQAARKPKHISVTAYEIDAYVIEELERTLKDCKAKCERAGIQFSSTVYHEDFIAAAASSLNGGLFSPKLPDFNAAIVNPPYRKLRSDSSSRQWLRSAGVETSNFYTAFIALIIRLLEEGGELVAITPRSFCNGPYFKSFRNDLMEMMSIRRLHLFESRSTAFGKDGVLQENIIVHAIKDRNQADEVIISSSSGRAEDEVSERRTSFDDVVSSDDAERFIHVGLNDEQARIKSVVNRLHTSLADLDLSVSTGRVVDFRSKEYLRQETGPGTVPLIYPTHFDNGIVAWPKSGSRKPNALLVDDNTRDLLVPKGVYVLVKRFSSKEERRRIVACVYDPESIPSDQIAFENHLNYFHIRGAGIPLTLAKGLAAFLNSSTVDGYFRQFSGHTQVNATDLRKLRYPTRVELENVGRKIKRPIDQRELDELISDEIFA